MTLPPPQRVLGVHLVISLAGAMGWYAAGPQHAMSFAAGAGMMGLNFWLLMVGWGQVLGKKSIALPVGIIVIKWSLFGSICILLARSKWVVPVPFVLGIGSIAASALVVALGRKMSPKA